MSSEIYRLIETCVAASDTEAFAEAVVELIGLTGVRQLMVFEFAGEVVTCLMSRNFARMRTGELLASRYMDGWYRKDPLLPKLMEMPAGEMRLMQMREIIAGMPADYLEIFFRQPGLSGKTTVLAAGAERRMMVNFYHGDGSAEPDENLLLLIARLVLQHFERRPVSAYPACLAVLSAREREICLGVLDGKKAELIAGELDLSPATVVTYRRRAYAKLGISSRGDLFALCRAG